MAEMTKVVYEELLARAAELDEVWEWLSVLPPINPPCDLAEAVDPTNQLRQSAKNILRELTTFVDRRAKLATALRNASTYYDYQDWDASEAIRRSTSVSPVAMPVGGDIRPDFDPAMLGDFGKLPMPPEIEDGLVGLMQLADQLHASDQGDSLEWAVTQWKGIANFLQDVRDQTFREFTEWEGDTATKVNSCFTDYRNWLDGMVTNCKMFADQAKKIKQAFLSLKPQHVWGEHFAGAAPTMHYEQRSDYLAFEQWYLTDPKGRLPRLMQIYQSLAKQSEELRRTFSDAASVPQINPGPLPGAIQVDPDKPFVPIPEPDTDPHHWEPLVPAPRPDQHTDYIPDIIHPAKKPKKPDPTPGPTPTPGGFHGLPTMPSMPMMPAAKTDPKLAEAVNGPTGAPSRPQGGSLGGGAKPASFGGAMPLQPPSVEGDPASRPAAGAGSGNLGRGGVPGGAGGAVGGGMGGGVPGQGGQGAAKGKRAQGQEESLYTEEREWTEGLIGRRRVKDAPDK
jgi:hypothetical protein